MAVAELFIGAFITVLFEKLASGDLIKLAQSAEIYSELNKWEDTLTQIQAVLVDAGHKHIEQNSIQLWLNKLQHLAYEIDDVLDDLATEAMRHQLNRESDASTGNNTSKVLKFVPNKLRALNYNHKTSSKLNGITTKLLDLVKEKERLGLIDNIKRPNKASRRLEETSLVDESKIIGREGDKEALLGKLLGGEASSSKNVNVVCIVGMGGIGKTTLAQLLYNDKKVKDRFELKAWICVSDEFHVFTISKVIFKDIGGDDRKFETLNQLQVALIEKLSKKRFLFVLDDVWNDNFNEWELLQRPFSAGASGSKVLVTTRKPMVASGMDSVQTYPLKLLSDEEALSLFAQHASADQQNLDLNQALKLYGEDIVKKCGKLPLALKALGRVFRTRSSYEEWEDLLNNEIWNLDNRSEILPALRLSYYDLPQHLKQMFVYCCLFPKDYMFDKNELILLWMAQGFLHQPNKNILMESFGGECFEELVSRSFFQHSNNDKSRYTMHELINDLATSVAGEFFFMLDVYDQNGAIERFHHLSFIREDFGAYKKFKALQRARRLRTFLAMSVNRLNNWDRFYISNKVLVEVVPQLQFLRVLSLAYYNITEVPRSIGSLKHMRYLNFSNTNITCLPEQVGDLHNLQSLLLSGCDFLSTLPNSIVKLIHLRHLDITNTLSLNKMPSGLGGLKGLHTLSRLIIGGAGDCRLTDLKDLLHLLGYLSIEGLDEVKDAFHIKEANLQKKKGICDLQMEWSDVFDESRNEKIEYDVLEGLQPFEKLTSLKIAYYMGTKFPSWVGDPSFACLTQLTLRGCRSCTCLPRLGHLPSLQKLCIESMDGLNSLGSDLLGPSSSCHDVAFPSLEVLEFVDMKRWVEWSISGGNKAQVFPCLHEMSIINCPKLDVVALELITSLRILSVEGCSLAVLKSMVGVSSSVTRLTMKNIKGLNQLHGKVLKHLKVVIYLNISWCDELVYLWESEAEAHATLVNLKSLDLIQCKNLVSLGKKEANLVNSIDCFREVRIMDCPRLESYDCPNNIENLEIRDCRSVASLTFPTNDDLRSTLKFMSISDCDNVEVSWLLMSSLEFLLVQRVPNLRLFSEGCLVHLTTLILSNCDNIESIPNNGYGFLPCLCLRYLTIIDCKNLKSFPHEHLQRLTSLEVMHKRNCPSLDYSFPCGLWPPNLSSISIGGLKKPISQWGMQIFPTSLVRLSLFGDEKSEVSFAKAEEDMSRSSSFLLPSSLITLYISDFRELESLSNGLKHLTGLQHLTIVGCPKLRDFPETLLPSLSSLRLWVSDCSPELRKKCRSRKGKYWPILSQIPNLELYLE
ncbi:putative disease resistance RPP13-like protein 1 [Bidens hawaiensis]|uniref:putative disease resistance RPP13-like protein 1 n=1 Tax=Bidens hawaiensis TaxID=980011 RepID=UPI00404B2A2D